MSGGFAGDSPPWRSRLAGESPAKLPQHDWPRPGESRETASHQQHASQERGASQMAPSSQGSPLLHTSAAQTVRPAGQSLARLGAGQPESHKGWEAGAGPSSQPRQSWGPQVPEWALKADRDTSDSALLMEARRSRVDAISGKLAPLLDTVTRHEAAQSARCRPHVQAFPVSLWCMLSRKVLCNTWQHCLQSLPL